MSQEHIAEAFEQVDRIVALVDEIESDHPRSWERGKDFLCSVRARASDIGATIDKLGRVTEGQQRALDNMEGGVIQWNPDLRDPDED